MLKFKRVPFTGTEIEEDEFDDDVDVDAAGLSGCRAWVWVSDGDKDSSLAGHLLTLQNSSRPR